MKEELTVAFGFGLTFITFSPLFTHTHTHTPNCIAHESENIL